VYGEDDDDGLYNSDEEGAMGDKKPKKKKSTKRTKLAQETKTMDEQPADSKKKQKKSTKLVHELNTVKSSEYISMNDLGSNSGLDLGFMSEQSMMAAFPEGWTNFPPSTSSSLLFFYQGRKLMLLWSRQPHQASYETISFHILTYSNCLTDIDTDWWLAQDAGPTTEGQTTVPSPTSQLTISIFLDAGPTTEGQTTVPSPTSQLTISIFLDEAPEEPAGIPQGVPKTPENGTQGRSETRISQIHLLMNAGQRFEYQGSTRRRNIPS
jgi:hypothetical protein